MNITLSLPPTDNHVYGQRGKIRFMYKEARDWKENAGLFIKSQYKKPIKIDDVEIPAIVFYLLRERDIQGSLKLLFDVMEGIVYINDKQIKQFCVFKRMVKENPRIEIEL